MPPPIPRKLSDYEGKRRFDETPEPSAAQDRQGASPPDGDPTATERRFVIHEHHARRLHWDLRLEHDGALASWAVPNGIPQDPEHNRKAVHVEDHPLSYLDFQGTIPSGNYGAGEITIWDRGTYTTEKWEPGKVVVLFAGERLQGRYALFRAGRTDKDWMMHRMDPASDATAEAMPDFVEPMLAKAGAVPKPDTDWAFEVKWDGIRAIARSQPGRLKLFSRNRNDVTAAYPELRALNRALGSHEAILDGEIVAFDANGRPSFGALQPRMHVRGEAAVRHHAEATPVTYVIFDLLWLDGHSLTDLPYRQRRARLDELKLNGDRWSTPAFHVAEGAGLLAATREQDLEGIVGKRLGSRYAPGRRDGSWLKIKHSARQELVIGGWTTGQGGRSGRLGALHLGVYDDAGALHYAGRVGTGFDAAELQRLGALLADLATDASPFVDPQPPRGAHFVRPELVCEVEFTEWTRDGQLRHPSYKGLRDDKPASSVMREDAPTVAEAIADGGVRSLIAHGAHVKGGIEIEVATRTLKVTNVGKVIYPDSGFTKGDLIGYYADIAPVLLPHLGDRPLTLKRYPNGVAEKFFYEKNCPKHRPEWVATAPIWSGHTARQIDYCVCGDLPTLVWMANLAALELHPSLSRAVQMDRPTILAFDLDPGAPATIVECCEVALGLRDMFAELRMRAFAKTSGNKGLQVYVPLNVESVTYEQTKPFAHAVADLFEQRHPKLVVSSMAKQRRGGKVLIDWSQNDEHKTTVSVYSLRATARPSVSTPVEWGEVSGCLDSGDAGRLTFSADDVLTRVADRGDLFAEVQTLAQELPAL